MYPINGKETIMRGKSKKVQCPSCGAMLAYNNTNLKKYQLPDRHVQCKRCKEKLPINESIEIVGNILLRKL